MKQSGFHIRAGSAARQAEEESRISGGAPPFPRVQAGSAARATEDARRVAEDRGPLRPAFALRAAGGRVFRTGAALSSTPTPDVQPQAATAASPTAAARVSPPSLPPRANPSASGSGGFSSFIRGLFRPDEPPQT